MGAGSDATTLNAIHAATEGNPLFVIETTRLLMARGAESLTPGAGWVMPRNIANVLRARLDSVSSESRGVLELAAIEGRDFSRGRLAAVSGRAVPELATSLAEAIDAALVEEITPGDYRFSHILIREVLYQDLALDRREALHLAHADVIEHRAGASVPWPELAHHLLQAGPAAAERAVNAARCAAQRAEAQHAPEEAVRYYSHALDAHASSGTDDEARRAELLLGEGRARILAGDVEAGRAGCAEVASIARTRGDPELLARTALELGAVFAYAQVSHTLVDLLGEALEALGPGDSALKARLKARRAAALQPCLPPEGPIAEAREAIAMARRVGDEPALLDALRMGCSALMDVTDTADRIDLNAESVLLAERLRDPIAALRGHMRLVFDCYEVADHTGAHAHLTACDRIAEKLGHPHYRWPVLAFHSMKAIRDGRFEEAREIAEQAAALGELAGESNVSNSLLLQRVGLLQLEGCFDELESLLGQLERLWSGSRIGEALSRLIVCAALGQAGISDDPRSRLDPTTVDDVMEIGDRTQLDRLAEVSQRTGDAALARRVLDSLQPSEDHYVSGGVAGLTWDFPKSRALALIHWVLGDPEEAQRLFEKALEQCETTGAPAHRAWVAWDLARLHVECGRPEVARTMLDEAANVARGLSMPGLLEHTERVRAELDQASEAVVAPERDASSKPGETGIRLRRDGELWLLVSHAGELRLKDTKGMQLLAQLLDEPGREFHVLDLVSPAVPVDGGDSGELLDRRARADYEERARDIGEELELARTNNDDGRTESLRAELEMIADELNRGVALGGRERRTGSAAERARVNVQRRLRDAIRRIEACDSELGRHLNDTVRTGTYCTYDAQ